MKRITVFTPTYNWGYILHQLYKSLLRQTCKDFKWLIIDDGSTDDTKELVEGWLDAGLIEIEYQARINGGKHRAHNTALNYLDTELTVVCDSDDYFVDDAIEKIIKKWDTIDKEQQKNCCGIIAYRGDKEKGRTLNGKVFSDQVIEMQFSPIYKIMKKGIFDTTLVHKTEILKQYPFPEIEGENFITENYVWRQMDEMYVYAVYPEILEICVYLEDGYTKSGKKNRFNNPKGQALYFKMMYFHSVGIKDKILNLTRYILFCKKAGVKSEWLDWKLQGVAHALSLLLEYKK